jgi:hypothetical protein
LLRWRRPLARNLAGVSADDRFVPALFAYFGIRDIAVGVYTLAATRPGGDVGKAIVVQGVADTTDAALLGAVVARGRLSRVRGVGAIGLAAVTALGEFATAMQLRRDAGPLL